ncbi:MAG: 23S rRNA (pseudouridine(1915)-N(3))-methyltransferase RlmH [Cryomorphaceae bacterium]|nr:23S rRNA (pseudouridine(1915)-N(3))-methyltransferase RlmH [Flavobacteriales bacterium]
MKVVILCVGKTDMSFVEEANDLYINRLKHYIPLEFRVIPEHKMWKKLDSAQRKIKEGEAILGELSASDIAVLLDEKSKLRSSEEFAGYLQKTMASGAKNLVFVIGGAFGFSDEVYRRVPARMSLSKMTFSHQMVRCFLLEQIYRAMTILRNEPYHNS